MSILDSINKGLLALNARAEKLNQSMQQKSEVQRLTQEIEGVVNIERITLDGALQYARTRVELDEKLRDPAFAKAYAELEARTKSTVRDGDVAETEAAPGPRPAAPDFTRREQHPDPAIESEVVATIQRLQSRRQQHLASVRAALESTPALRPYFSEFLREHGGEHYLASTGP